MEPGAQHVLRLLADFLVDELERLGMAARLTVVRGWCAALDGDPAAVALRAAGASWDWVAIGVPPLSFWDVHVGILLKERQAPEAQIAVGLHWRPGVDAVVRPLALELFPGEAISYSTLTGEYQHEIPAQATGMAAAADAALGLAMNVVKTVTVRPVLLPPA